MISATVTTPYGELYRTVLAAIADGAENAAELARAALAKKLRFARWCA